MPLSDLQIRKAKPAEKTVKLSDGLGLQVWITPNGAKTFYQSFRFAGRQDAVRGGRYPETSLAEAREFRDKIRRYLEKGLDPKVALNAEKASHSENTFGQIAQQLIDEKRAHDRGVRTVAKDEWLAALWEPVASTSIRRLQDDVPALASVVEKVRARGTSSAADRMVGFAGQVFRLAIRKGVATADPTAALRTGAPKPVVKHRAAITAERPLGVLLRSIESYEGAPETRLYLQILAHTFVRPGELRLAKWDEFDFSNAVWVIPAERMKMRRKFRVPLSRQVLAMLDELARYSGSKPFLFPNVVSRDQAMSNNTATYALRRMGFTADEMTAHGFRSSASTLLNGSLKWSPDVIEASLAHESEDEIRAAYNRAQYWPERLKLYAWYSDKLDSIRKEGAESPLAKVAGARK